MESITASDLPEVMLKAKLQRLGLLDPISVDGNVLPALKVQLTRYNNEAQGLAKTDRILCIICSGRGNIQSARYVDTPSFLIVVAGTADEGDAINAKLLATLIESKLVESYQDSCDLIGAVPTGVVGPMYDEGGRVIYEINGSLLINKF